MERGLISNRYTVTIMLLVYVIVGFTEVVPTVGGVRGKRELTISYI